MSMSWPQRLEQATRRVKTVYTHIHARTQVKTVLLVLASYSSFYVAEHIVGTSGVSMPRDSGRAGWVGGPSRLSSNHCFVVNRSLLS